MSFSIVAAMNVGSRAQAAIACLCAVAVSACGEQASGEGEVRVVATTSQVADLTRNVAGDRAHVHGLLPPNADPHDYDVRPSDVAELAEADVIVRSGGELDAWLDDAIGSSGADAPAVTLLEEVGATTEEPHWFQDPRRASAAVDALARALAERPRLLLMDEPFGALDEMTRERMNSEVLRIWQQTGTTIVFVTHSIPEAVFLSTRVVVMSARPGRITRVIDVPLPHPRNDETREDPRYFAVVTEVREALRAGGGLDAPPPGASMERLAAEGGVG
jgi:hypothetical protein